MVASVPLMNFLPFFAGHLPTSRRALRLLALYMATSVACSTTEASNDARTVGTPSAEKPGEETGVPCTESELKEVFSGDIWGGPALDFSTSHLGFAHVDATGVPSVSVYDLATEESATITVASKVLTARYGDHSVTTSLAANGSGFGLGWYTERVSSVPNQGPGVWSTRFAVVDPAAGIASRPQTGNPDVGRSGAEDLVQAREPHVIAKDDGYFMMWEDTRTKEPRVVDVNLSGWSGIYGQAYDANGAPLGSDVQVVQSRAHSITGVGVGTEVMAVWNAQESDFTTHIYPRMGPFSPRSKPDPIYAEKVRPQMLLGSAVVGEGRIAVATSAGGVLGVMILDAQGSVLKAHTTWETTEQASTSPIRIYPLGTGFAVATFNYADIRSPNGIRLDYLTTDGERLGGTVVPLSLPDASPSSALALRSVKGKLWFAVATTQGEQSRTVKVQVGGVCPSLSKGSVSGG